MSVWPVPDSYAKDIPKNGAQGSFWEDRDEKFNCGIDIFAPAGSEVLAIESGMVFITDVFTSHNDGNYFNKTYYIVVRTPHKIFFKYAALQEVLVNVGDQVRQGQPIGKVGTIFNENRIDMETPYYIMDLVNLGNTSMLHMELYKFPVIEIKPYMAGNFLGKQKPYSLLDPALYLNGSRKLF